MTEKKTSPSPVLGFDPDMQIPLCGEPGYQHPKSGDGFIDERFGGLDTRGSGVGSGDLKRFLQQHLDREAAKKTPAALVHVGDSQFRVYYDAGTWRAKGVGPDGDLHQFSGKTRDEVLDKLAALSRQAQSEIRKVSAEQLRTIAWMVQSGDIAGAVAKYLESSIPDGEEIGAEKLLADAKYAHVLDEASFFVWSQSRHDYSLTDQEFPKFLARWSEGKPISVPVIDAAYDAYKAESQKLQREEVVARFGKSQEQSPQDVRQSLEDADDETIRKTYWVTAKHVARASR